jgi:UDP-glucose 4-epimerase
MRVLVTGGAGFVGSHLVDRLLRDGHSVRVLDDLSSGRAANLDEHARDPRLAFERADVRDAARVRAAARGAEVVFHLAAAVGVRKVAEDPVDTWSRNVEGTAVVLRAAAEAGARCVLASSSEVYGPTADGVLREDDVLRLDAAARRDAYALSKAAGESLALALHRTRLFPAVVARLFNVVGPRQSARYGMVLPGFAAAAVRGEPLPVHGDGGQARCFLHVRDAVEALLALSRSPDAEGRVVNVGTDEESTVLDLARAVVAAAGTGAPIRLVPFAQVYGEGFSDPRRRRPDVSRLRGLTGFVPSLRLCDAVTEAVAHARREAPVLAGLGLGPG